MTWLYPFRNQEGYLFPKFHECQDYDWKAFSFLLNPGSLRLQVNHLIKWRPPAPSICAPLEIRNMTWDCFGELTYFVWWEARARVVRRHCSKYDIIQLSKHVQFNSAVIHSPKSRCLSSHNLRVSFLLVKVTCSNHVCQSCICF